MVRPDGRHDTFTHVIVPGSVTVLAMDEADRVVLTRQWIYTHGGTQWRLPGGGVEKQDADPEVAAWRELARATGLRAASWSRIGYIHGADCLSNHVDHLFLATGLTKGGEADLRVRRLRFDDAVNLVRQGQLPHAGSAHALLAVALTRAGC